jgi:hypothetical protein
MFTLFTTHRLYNSVDVDYLLSLRLVYTPTWPRLFLMSLEKVRVLRLRMTCTCSILEIKFIRMERRVGIMDLSF